MTNNFFYKFFEYFIIASFLLTVQVTSLFAQEKNTDSPGHVSLEPTTAGLGSDNTIRIALVFQLKKGWKIYAPSEQEDSFSTYPPEIVWSPQSKNFKSATIIWPPYKKENFEGFKVNIYEGRTILPIDITIQNPHEPLFLKGTLSYLACKATCIPVETPILLYLAPGEATPLNLSAQVNKALKGSKHDSLLFDDEEGEMNLWLMIGIAFLGGVILNFMPCVLPILTLKIMTLKKISRHQHAFSYRWRFLSSLSGILVSFIIFALGAIILRAIEIQVGWGMHFQEPLFLTFMAIVMTIFACNLWGFFEINLPLTFNKQIDSLLGHHNAHVKVLTGDFFSGIFATFLATPCTAPFLGTAIGYSLSRGPIEILLMFFTLGVGFALPYWIGLMLPSRFLILPKAGPWMQTMTRILGFGLALTVLWILWILSEEVSFLATIILSLLLVGLCINLWYRRNPVLSTALILFSFFIIFFGDDLPEVWEEDTINAYVTPFSEEKIPEFVAAGKVVFVDVHAKWCITCQVNHKLVLQSEKIRKLLASDKIEVMSADWTNRDPNIAHFLARYHRYGIPFNIVFGPRAPQGIILSELLQQKEILEALKTAGLKE
ncbi:protein-disulfide reductase DsbD family protein [Candidatus Nucleicultrix amoebiphila]|jgi:suppressor for copper-sensitivity B|uniref:Uncharacterized protein n=1 Tax=Candidatus Nucleicultrix amoebiphila FS5 TaxID=1414854 RepID=A0A1W6N5K4_9PROT|nr:thioredoxin family protein [Candidatus Nucleicultrix amoebiphila]ARN85144.1 hypothetical protein GQ61_07445 [Candidatus Nucleicultrix amoebiphila FS5]